MNILVFALSCFCFFLLSGGEGDEFLVIDSELADYDGSKITLSGKVVIEHELGNISAGKMVLNPEDGGRKVRFACLDMHENVKIAFKDGGQLGCSSAHIDSKLMKGSFSGNADQEYVVYSESRRDKSGNFLPLLLKSRKMQIRLHQEEGGENNYPSVSISELTADDNVTVNYNHEIISLADHAVYDRNLSKKGQILMSALENGGRCQVTNRNGDIIRASQLVIDPSERRIIFHSPKGSILIPKEKEGQNCIDFSCQMMVWDETDDILTLRDKVVINQEGIGQISNGKEVLIYRHVVNGHKSLRSIESFGETELDYADKENNAFHHLTCHGKVVVDHEKLQTCFESPALLDGKVVKGKQIYFHDRLGEIYADKAVISYDYINDRIVPAKITLTGHVQILNRTAADAEDRGKFLQYAIADYVEYFPLKSKMYFKSDMDSRVLFFDKANNVKVSAPALKIIRSPDSNKNSIEGIGDVRFSFIEEELEELRKRFQLPEEGS